MLKNKRIKYTLQVIQEKMCYTLEEAILILKRLPQSNFDETVELYANLVVDPTHLIRGTVQLPHGSRKKVTLAAFTENPEIALEAGADYAGLSPLIEKILNKSIKFDVAVSTTSAMKEVRKISRILGPRGLMPNTKNGTISDDVVKIIKEIKSGRIEYKMDKVGNLSIILGKTSLSKKELIDNMHAVIDVLNQNVKNTLIKTLSISTTMSASIKLYISPVIKTHYED